MKEVSQYVLGNAYFSSVHVLPDSSLFSVEFLDGYYEAWRYHDNYLRDGACFGKKRRFHPLSSR